MNNKKLYNPTTIKEINKLINSFNEGITLNLNGSIPEYKKGFYCSITNNIYNKVTLKEINKLIITAQNLQNKTGIKHYIGSWYSTKTNKWYIDISRRFYKKSIAIKEAIKFNQEAIFNLSNFESIYIKKVI